MAAVPVLTLSDEAEKPKDIPAPRLGSRSDSISAGSVDQGTGTHIKRRTKKEEAIEYFNTHGIPDTMNALVTQLLIQKPEYPLSFCIQFLRTTAAIRSPSATAAREEAKSVEERMKAKLGDVSSREYLLDHKLPWMFDDLLSNILLEKPDDPQAFCLTWLRWNRSKYSENDKETDFGIQLAEIPNLSNVESFSTADL